MSVPRQQNEWPCDRGIEIASFYNFSIEFWKCSDSGIFLFFIIIDEFNSDGYMKQQSL
jgi:hypothetical protein